MKRIILPMLLFQWLRTGTALAALCFQLPTANQALFQPGNEETFFAGTAGKLWTSGTFGCVRTDGRQMHEGLDIKCLKRDAKGEPIDPIMAAADGTVAYLNLRPGLSNYGKYVILKHRIEGLEIYTLYAHLSEIRRDLKPGDPVEAGQTIAIMGRTSNTGEAIAKERAHLHFEIGLLVSERFPAWYKKTFPGQRNDHGAWNGQNFLGLDPRLIFLAQKKEGAAFSLLHHIRSRTELCRVLVRDTRFPWLKRYTPLIRRNALADKEGAAAYEMALNFNGIPFLLIPRAASEIRRSDRFQLLSVNEAEQQKNPCRRLVRQRGRRWELTQQGKNLLTLLTY
ncbi:MAG: M23 family metallopeptidase [Chloroflexi bacterium]|nr:M23 family metallopeptidase [Chloroflexota bacterium]